MKLCKDCNNYKLGNYPTETLCQRPNGISLVTGKTAYLYNHPEVERSEIGTCGTEGKCFVERTPRESLLDKLASWYFSRPF